MYELLQLKEEAKRSILSVLFVGWLVRDNYVQAVACQDGPNKLTRTTWRALRDAPSCPEMVDGLRDVLTSWDLDSAHFVGHSFGSIVVDWMCKNAKETVKIATFLYPERFFLIKPKACHNLMCQNPETPTQLLLHYFVALRCARALHYANCPRWKFREVRWLCCPARSSLLQHIPFAAIQLAGCSRAQTPSGLFDFRISDMGR
ncbi:CYP704C1 [Symbiodinium natans]|uniref:CYP704C1 protein n=1 Tax=Symbiodinium natans TaxID=878477 RepID=A0A812RUF5_9DINO|nr:CYP704C1 [Symbiodinium natans]